MSRPSSSSLGEVLPAVILCGGSGTRIRPLYPDRPKALVPLAGRPFLGWQLDWLWRQGVRRVLLAAGVGGRRLRGWVEGQAWPAGCSVEISVEPRPLGTAGGLLRNLGAIDGEAFWVLNGDTLLPRLELRRLGRWPGAAALAAVDLPATGTQGRLEIDAEGRVLGFSGNASSDRVNGGVYRLEKGLLRGFAGARSLEAEVFPELARAGALWAAATEPPLLDMGTPEGLAAMEAHLVGQRGSDPEP